MRDDDMETIGLRPQASDTPLGTDADETDADADEADAADGDTTDTTDGDTTDA
ncbi:MAG: hypothetical protein H0V52_09220 [Acidimicrobiia bacterium]|nr:hypothetical protein [Acidimicrobiia bacterium]